MLHSVDRFFGFRIDAINGDIGRVYDIFLDDAQWVVRYVVADTGSWLRGRRVLLSPWVLHVPDWEKRVLPIDLTRDMVENSPDVNADPPVSRQTERQIIDYFGWPVYWTPAAAAFGAIASGSPPPPPAPQVDVPQHEKREDPHLRSAREMLGYHIAATDGEVGHVEDFLLEPEGWHIRYLVIDTRNWLPGRKVLVAPPWIELIRWEDRKVHVSVDRETIRHSPRYDVHVAVTREYEQALHTHYQRAGYWEPEGPVRLRV